VHIFLHFSDGQKNNIKHWISGIAERITSAQQQLEEAELYRRYKQPGRVFMSFFLSAKGYEYLHPISRARRHFDDEAFLHGMRAAQHRLNDPPQDTWEPGYQRDIHAMVLLADDDEALLLQEASKLRESMRTHAEVCTVEYGKAMWKGGEYPVEHFGFVDSRSQPLFFQRDVERERQQGDGTNVWDPGAGPDLVLVPDPYGRDEYDSGSYLVFRKLEQHVRAYKEHEQKLAKVLGLPAKDVNRAGALVMGRFEDGTPIALQAAPGRSASVPNNFTYDDDPDGRKCPLQAHIRKVNPRTKGVPRIVRRGITYGDRVREPQYHPGVEETPSAGVGLLFMCYQRNIAQQFEVLQYLWANDPRLPRERQPGIDPIIGQMGGNGVGQQKWPAQWNDPPEKHRAFDFHGFVTLKGGEYFFAPSIYFLKNLAKDVG
jgi:Dyp-type peroxidase family